MAEWTSSHLPIKFFIGDQGFSAAFKNALMTGTSFLAVKYISVSVISALPVSMSRFIKRGSCPISAYETKPTPNPLATNSWSASRPVTSMTGDNSIFYSNASETNVSRVWEPFSRKIKGSFLKSWNDREFGIGLKNFFDAIAFIFDVPKVTVCKSGPSTGLPMTPISAS